MQYDNPNTPDVGEVFGSVICKVLFTRYSVSVVCVHVQVEVLNSGLVPYNW